MSGASRLRVPLLMFIALVVVGAIAFAVRSRGGGPPTVTEVPRTLPASGVAVNNLIDLKPLLQAPAHALSKAAAIAAARNYGVKHRYPARAMEAAATISGDPHLQSTPAWVVTFTYPKPVNVSQAKTPVLVTHDTILVDATTGKFLLGFFTK